MEMNKAIRRYIQNNNLKFGFVAERAGYNIKKFSRFMTSRQPLTIDDYERICRDGLRIDPCYFFSQNVLETKTGNVS